MPDRAQYDATQIDWPKLRRYAARVARETRMTPLPAVTSTRQVEKEVPVQKRTKGFLGMGAKDYTVTERQKVKETEEVLGPHWVLALRSREREKNSRSGKVKVISEFTEEYTYVLMQDGSLMILKRDIELVFNIGGPNDGLVHKDVQSHQRPLNDDYDVIRLDFADSDQMYLRRHAKGVGINLALKDLLEGREPRRA